MRQEKNRRDGTSTRSPSLQSQKTEKQEVPSKALALGHRSCHSQTTSNRGADSPVSEILWGHWLQGHWPWGAENKKRVFISNVSQSFHAAFPRQPTWNHQSPDQCLRMQTPDALSVHSVPTTSLTSPISFLVPSATSLLCATLYSKGLELGTRAKVEGHWLTEIVRNDVCPQIQPFFKEKFSALFLFSKASMINQIRSNYFICS